MRVPQKVTLTLNDSNREKDLEVLVTVPVSTESQYRSFPLIIFSHGAFGSKEGYSPLINRWVGNGYLAIQPMHEDSLKLFERGACRVPGCRNEE